MKSVGNIPRRYSLKKLLPAILLSIFILTLGLYAQDSGGASSVNASGTWKISIQSRRGNQEGTLHIQQDGSKLSGTFEGPRGNSSDLTGSIQDNNVSFSIQMQGRRTVTLAFTGTMNGDNMTGTFQPQGGEEHGGGRHGQGSRSWTATRQQGKSGESRPNQNQDDDYADGL